MRVGGILWGRRPAFGGRRPRAEAAASPQGWPPLKTSLSIHKVFDCKGYKACKSAGAAKFLRLLMEEDTWQGGLSADTFWGFLLLSWSGSFIVGG
jgi:hypothetical protein